MSTTIFKRAHDILRNDQFFKMIKGTIALSVPHVSFEKGKYIRSIKEALDKDRSQKNIRKRKGNIELSFRFL